MKPQSPVGYLHAGGEEPPRQRWSSSGLEAEIHPSQNHCHLGSRVGSGPATPKLFMMKPNLNQILFLLSMNDIISQHTHRFVFDGGAGDTQVQFAVLLDAGIDQGLNRTLVLEQQECVPYTRIRRWSDECTQKHKLKTLKRMFHSPFGGK